MRTFIWVVLLLVSTQGRSAFHLWDIAEIYSSADGSVQFIELFCPVDGQQFLINHDMVATSDGNVVTFTFPSNSGDPTQNKRLLLATANFAALPGAVTPDFILPDNFFDPNAANIQFDFGPGQDIINLTGADIPSDGLSSIDDGLNQATNTPTNFAGDTGEIFVDPDLIFASNFD